MGVVRELMEELGLDIPVYGMVKDDFHKTRALCTEDGEISIARENAVFVLVYRIQEEVHRFTVSRMDAAKRKTLTHSSLTKIKGIGDAKAKALLAAFKGMAGVKAATEEELAAVKGISKADAASVRAYFNTRRSYTKRLKVASQSFFSSQNPPCIHHSGIIEVIRTEALRLFLRPCEPQTCKIHPEYPLPDTKA